MSLITSTNDPSDPALMLSMINLRPFIRSILSSPALQLRNGHIRA
jgi:hypothetical protein